jgi:hypothetical protein
MIKAGLKSHSKSNGRELEYTILSLQNETIENEFSQLIKKILHQKQINPSSHNGLRKFNTLFETYIKKVYKEYKTVNVYARQLNSDNFLAFWEKLKKLIKANPNLFQGRLEPHPADREINSWHIQYTGANAKYIEKILAAFIVKEGAESSMDMALGRDTKPYFKTTNTFNDIQLVNDKLLVQELINKSNIIFIDDDLEQTNNIIKSITLEIKETLDKPKISLRDRLESIKTTLNINTKKQVFDDIKSRKSKQARDIIDRIKKDKE